MNLGELHAPSLVDPAAGYKDWLHVNLFDHASGSVGLFNVSLHGSPQDPRARAVGVALVHVPSLGWVGNVEVSDLRDANLGVSSISLEQIAVGVDSRGDRVLASARLAAEGLSCWLCAESESRPIDIERRIPFGSGWISWSVLPRLSVAGNLTVRGRTIDLARATAYHDRTWGRWHWGDDAGWEWGAFLAPEQGPSFVLCRTTDRAHRRREPAMLIADVGAIRRRFLGTSMEISYERGREVPLRRLPGALAALHQDRMAPHLATRIKISAADGFDSVQIDFRLRAVAQVIAADPEERGYGFIHEMVGDFIAKGRIDGRDLSSAGLAVMEYVD